MRNFIEVALSKHTCVPNNHIKVPYLTFVYGGAPVPLGTKPTSSVAAGENRRDNGPSLPTQSRHCRALFFAALRHRISCRWNLLPPDHGD